MRTKIQEIRNEAINNIKALMGSLSRLYMTDIDEGSSPIVCENNYDYDLTTTLDSIEQKENGQLTFYHSSSCSNGWLSENEIPTDALIDIAEFLEERKEQIQEIINETDVTADDEDEQALDELYDEVCRALTDYEHPQEAGLTECEAAQGMYRVLTKIQNDWVELISNK